MSQPMHQRTITQTNVAFIAFAAFGLLVGAAGRADEASMSDGTYSNPLPVVSAEHGLVESCPDPDVLEGAEGDPNWYLYCTTGPLRSDELSESGGLGWHQIPMFQSSDLVNWQFAGDAFDADPATAAAPLPALLEPGADLWAPEVQRIGNRYYLSYTVTNTTDAAGGMVGCKGDSSIGYAMGDSPLGPWQAESAPLIAPRQAGEGCKFFWTIDPEVFEDAVGNHHIFYGGASGGIEGRRLLIAEDGSLTAPVSSAIPITIGNRWSFEGAEVIRVNEFYYLFASATSCCNGPQTGYTVLVGRSESPTGPFVDRQGASFLDATVGGTPFLAQNGNRWIGPGHNVLVRDRAGQWWTLYHAVEEDAPYFAGMTGFTRRPLLLDPVSWTDGWPMVNGGAGPSDAPQRAPAMLPDGKEGSAQLPLRMDEPGRLLLSSSDEFEEPVLSERWIWTRGPATRLTTLRAGRLALATQAGDLRDADNRPAFLGLETPEGDILIETRVRLLVPEEGCCPHRIQAGIVIHRDDGNYVKLALIRVRETWQIEFARAVEPVPRDYPSYGNSVIGPPGNEWTWLRIVVRRQADEEVYTASSSRDGEIWVRGSSWTHRLEDETRIGLIAVGGEGLTAEFDYFRVSELGP